MTAARTRQALSDLFTDLPAPHPHFGTGEIPLAGVSPDRTVAQQEEPVPARVRAGTVVQRVAAGVMGGGWILGIGLAVITGVWWFIFLPIVLSAVCGSVWGKGWDHHLRREQEESREQRWERRLERRHRRDRY